MDSRLLRFSLSRSKFTLSAIIAIVVVALVTYAPALRIGFLDGWWYLDWVSRMDLPRYIIQFIDPTNITQGYRPVQGLYILVLYTLFQFNPDGYHWAHNLLHAANSVLLFAIVARLAKNWRVAILAALLYVAAPIYSMAVFWHAVVDPLSAFFYLLTLWLWTRYLDFEAPARYALTWLAYIFALFSKEVAVFLPALLLLIQWWFYGKPLPLRDAVRQFVPFSLPFCAYIPLVIAVQTRGEFVGQFGFKIGPNMLVSLAHYLAVLAFPWLGALPTEPLQFAWLALVALVFVVVAVRAKSAPLYFLAIFAVLNIAPLTGFPLEYFGTRYLYTAVMAAMVALALLFHLAHSRLARVSRAFASFTAFIVAGIVIANSVTVAEAAAGLAEYTRQLRVPFRDIARAHPTFPENSYLYFVYSPRTPLSDLQGFFLVRYGHQLRVSGTDAFQPAQLRESANTFVYYFDEQASPREIIVAGAAPRASLALPQVWNAPIRLEGFEVANSALKRGEPLILFLYWRATEKIDKDYTVFAHVLDAKGARVGGLDSPPRQGTAPTSAWKSNVLVVDAMVVPIEKELRAGEEYRIELGMYYLPTLERLWLVDENGQPVAETLVLEPITVEK